MNYFILTTTCKKDTVNNFISQWQNLGSKQLRNVAKDTQLGGRWQGYECKQFDSSACKHHFILYDVS